ncbi:hypothetical protein OHA40_01950 [Nocardia sp. NBC_00508]|uniref:hypothetical protein n=1 Tax=Nocardia sp. NBC_00508 TaxID=2975992 RepID=UPI002E809DEB|nr:hypothetical protein [Nocardia sp. NBC_00508]WUD66956.1 hypothetical protein OHA40_01950 [Nocardia sp. NBC_00508]
MSPTLTTGDLLAGIGQEPVLAAEVDTFDDRYLAAVQRVQHAARELRAQTADLISGHCHSWPGGTSRAAITVATKSSGAYAMFLSPVRTVVQQAR